MRRVHTGVGAIAGLVMFAIAACAHAQPADLVLSGGRIVTLTPQAPEVEALAIRGDRIAAMGTSAAMRAWVGPNTKVLELGGKLVLPGFIDGHGHFLSLGLSRQQLDLTRARNWEEIVALVARAAAQARPGDWILGRGWHQEKWDRVPRPNVDGLPLNAELNRVSPDNPVLLSHASGHSLIANARAMELAGLSRTSPDPAGGQMVRTAAGALTGVFRENAASLLEGGYAAWQAKRTPEQIEADQRQAIQLATRECLSKGVTSFQDAGSSLALVDLYKRLAAEGHLGVRLWVMLADDDTQLAAALPAARVIDAGDHRLTVRAIKRYADGALGSHGAWLLAPYADLPSSCGMNVTPMAAIEKTAELALKYDLQLCVHAIGDRANREVLDVYQRVLGSRADGRARRWRIEHAQHLDPVDIPRFGRLGVIASMQGVHCTSDGPWVVKRIGKERAASGAYAWRALLDSGATVSNGTDTPVEDVDPIPGFYALVTRRMADGKASFPGQRMSHAEALAAMTRNAAWAAFEEDQKGSLAPGMLADLVVLSQDLLRVPEEQIPATRVMMTISGGKVVYRRH